MAKRQLSPQIAGGREPGIDLLRCVALLFVVGVHSFLYNGFYSEPQVGSAIWPATSFRWLFFSCNGLFMMLTGYLKTTKPFSAKYYKSLVPIMVSYTLICLLTFPIRHTLLNEKKSLVEWLKLWIQFGNYAWYLEMYIGLLLVSPALNFMMDALKPGRQQLGAVAVGLVLTALPTITDLNLVPDYWIALYPMTYYLIGAYIKRSQPKVRPASGLALTVLTIIFLGLVSLTSTDEGFSNGFTQGYGGFWIVLITTSLFLALYRLPISPRFAKILSWAAGGVLEGYLLSRLMDVWLYSKFPQWHSPEKYILLFICVTIPIYLYALLAGKLVHAISAWVMKLFTGKCKTSTPV